MFTAIFLTFLTVFVYFFVVTKLFVFTAEFESTALALATWMTSWAAWTGLCLVLIGFIITYVPKFCY